jgi:fumarate reductase subunit C
MEQPIKKTWWSKLTEGERAILSFTVPTLFIVIAILVYVKFIKKDTSNILTFLEDFKAI